MQRAQMMSERESTYVSAVTATVWRKKGGRREKKKGERGEKELSETGGGEGTARRTLSVISHAPSHCTGCEGIEVFNFLSFLCSIGEASLKIYL